MRPDDVPGIYADLIVDWTQDGYSVSEIAKLLKETEEFVRKVQEESGVFV